MRGNNKRESPQENYKIICVTLLVFIFGWKTSFQSSFVSNVPSLEEILSYLGVSVLNDYFRLKKEDN